MGAKYSAAAQNILRRRKIFWRRKIFCGGAKYSAAPHSPPFRQHNTADPLSRRANLTELM